MSFVAMTALPKIMRAACAGLVLVLAPAWATETTGDDAVGTGTAGATPDAHEAPEGPRYWFTGSLSPEELDRTDWLLMRQNILLALYELDDGQSVIWVNPMRGHSGNVRVLSTNPEKEGMNCRILRISIDLERASADDVFRFCRAPERFWVLAQPLEEPEAMPANTLPEADEATIPE